MSSQKPTCPRCLRSGSGVRFRLDFADPENPFKACEDCERVAAAEGEKAKALTSSVLALVIEEINDAVKKINKEEK